MRRVLNPVKLFADEEAIETLSLRPDPPQGTEPVKLFADEEAIETTMAGPLYPSYRLSL